MTDPTITGVVKVGTELTGNPQGYADAENDAQGTHTYNWYRADNTAGTTNKVQISGALTNKYTPTAEDQGKYLVFEVTPVSATGTPNTSAANARSKVTATAVPRSEERRVGTMSGTVGVGETFTGAVGYDDAE